MNKQTVGVVSFGVGLLSGIGIGLLIGKTYFEDLYNEKLNRAMAKVDGKINDIIYAHKDVQEETYDQSEVNVSEEDLPGIIDDLIERKQHIKVIGVDQASDEEYGSHPAKMATPWADGVNYKAYGDRVKKRNNTPEDDDYAEEEHPVDSDEDDGEVNEEDCMETYAERIESEIKESSEMDEKYRKEHKGQIIPITEAEFHSPCPEVLYPHEDLYYFSDGKLCDDDGNDLEVIEDYLGDRPGKFGWFDNDEPIIFIRNNVLEKDYQVNKEHCTRAEWG